MIGDTKGWARSICMTYGRSLAASCRRTPRTLRRRRAHVVALSPLLSKTFRLEFSRSDAYQSPLSSSKVVVEYVFYQTGSRCERFCGKWGTECEPQVAWAIQPSLSFGLPSNTD